MRTLLFTHRKLKPRFLNFSSNNALENSVIYEVGESGKPEVKNNPKAE